MDSNLLKKTGEKKQKLTVCYFGSYDSEFSRNRIYMRGLRENGVQVIECNDTSRGFSKYWRLFRKHWMIRNKYNIMIVGYPGHVIAPFARFISSKPIIFDALGTLYEAEIFSHKAGPLKGLKMKCIDWLAIKSAHMVLVESEHQRQFLIHKFSSKQNKFRVLYTGVDDNIFHPDVSIRKESVFTVLFRGRLTPEAGVSYILLAAEMLRHKNIHLRIIGFGICKKEIEQQIKDFKLNNVEFISKALSFEELTQRMNECHISLGQFEHNDRLKRTIPHKAFESLAMQIPYITGRAEGVQEILKDGENCLMVNLADPEDIAKKILLLKNNRILREKLAKNGYYTHQCRFTPQVLGNHLLQMCQSFSQE